jgi:hypothetical protein
MARRTIRVNDLNLRNSAGNASRRVCSPTITCLRRVGEVKALLKPYPAEQMTGYAASRVVNNPRNDSPRCIEPLAEAG